MSRIEIQHPHTQSPEQTRQALEEVAGKLSSRFGVDHHWEGDTLAFNGAGVDGRIAMQPDALHVTAELGFLMSAMKGPIESEIRRVLSERFA
ncbi:MAG: polyhydroxyalkanoic acid system family protein [Pseudoxanthomonas sp.]|jgi:putative polyhydroxyalkanoate system protein